MKETANFSGWYLSLVLTIAGLVIINQCLLINSFEKRMLIILIALPAVAVILWLFFKTGLASWAEKWINSSFDDFFKEVEKGKNKKLK